MMPRQFLPSLLWEVEIKVEILTFTAILRDTSLMLSKGG